MGPPPVTLVCSMTNHLNSLRLTTPWGFRCSNWDELVILVVWLLLKTGSKSRKRWLGQWGRDWGRAELWFSVNVYLVNCGLLCRGASNGRVLCLHLRPCLPGISLCPLQISAVSQGSGTFEVLRKWNFPKPWDLFCWNHVESWLSSKVRAQVFKTHCILPGSLVLENQVGSPWITNTQIMQDPHKQLVTNQGWFHGCSQRACDQKGPCLV